VITFTIDQAKGLFFDPKKILDPAEKATQQMLSKFGGYVKRTAKNSIKTSEEFSKPGQPPKSRGGKVRYKDFVFYVYDRALKEVVIGAVLLPRKTSTKVPQVLEYGGTKEANEFKGRVHKKIATSQTERPHMRPAFDKAVKRLLPELIANSIVKG